MKKEKTLFIVIIALIIIFIGASFAYKSLNKSKPLDSKKMSNLIRDYSTTLGSDDAKVSVVEFLDPGCPACATFYPSVKKILNKYDGKVKFVQRYMAFHPGSDYAVKMIFAAKKQGKFEEMLAVLFANQEKWFGKPNVIWQFIPSSIDQSQLANDMKNPELVGILNQEDKDSKVLNITQTPTFFINGKKLSDDEFSPQGLEDAIKKELN